MSGTASGGSSIKSDILLQGGVSGLAANFAGVTGVCASDELGKLRRPTNPSALITPMTSRKCFLMTWPLSDAANVTLARAPFLQQRRWNGEKKDKRNVKIESR